MSGTGDDGLIEDRPSPAFRRFFSWYANRLVVRRFHALRLLVGSREVIEEASNGRSPPDRLDQSFVVVGPAGRPRALAKSHAPSGHSHADGERATLAIPILSDGSGCSGSIPMTRLPWIE